MYIRQFDRRYSLMGYLFLFLAVLFLLSRCSKERDIRAYYFPLRDLEDGLVYEYQPVDNDTLPPIYWYYRSFLYPDSIFLTGTRYSRDLLPEQFTREELVANGMLTVDSYVYELDSTGRQQQVPVEVVAGSSFPFEVAEEGGLFLHRLKWTSEVDPMVSYEVVKNRRFGGDTTFVWQGRRRGAVYLTLREAIDQRAEGVLSLESEGEEVYVRDIGLVYFEKRFSEGFKVAYRLSDRYPMEVLEEKFKALYNE